ncbi:MAG: PQQ-dependent sugar dehydrogenase [Saprospiraceae bacterium]|nr:PQQ-dependent sugar dehydrogenase [Saprospiraceae bacterium]
MYKYLIVNLLLISLSFNVSGQFDFNLEPFSEGFDLPLDIVHNGSDRLFIVEKNGRIMMADANGQKMPDPFLDITDRVDASRSEKGLLGLAFHPDFESNGEFYVNYTNSNDITVISRFRTLPGQPFRGDPNSEQKLLQYFQPFSNHNGGDLAFGPDGYLYISSGDGGSANDPMNNGQTGTTLLGKLLRIDVNDTLTYKVPPTNPFVGNAGVEDEIWCLGLRNPWRMSFDRMTGDLWIGDVGQGSWEEIDFQPASSNGGENYGWRCYEGNHQFNTQGCEPRENYQFPIWEYANNRVRNGCSVTGGYVYRGAQFPEMFGWYIYADFCSGKFWALRGSDTTNIAIGDFASNEFVGFGEDDDGELYVAAIREGRIYKLVVPCDIDLSIDLANESCPDMMDGTAEVILSDTTVDVSILWSTGDTSNKISGLAPGIYTVEVTSSSCSLSDTIRIAPSDLQMSCLLDTVFSESFCEGDTVRINACEAPPGYTYEWSNFDAVIAETTEPVLKITEGGVYSVSFKGDCPLGSSEEVEIVFNETPEMPAISQMSDTLSTNITADKYRWYLNDTLLAETDLPYIVILEEGDYKVQGINGLDCEGPVSEAFSVIGTAVKNEKDLPVSVYPNPSSGWITLEYGKYEVEISEIQIYSGTGQLIKEISEFHDQKLDLRGYPESVYFIKVFTKNNNYKILKVLLSEDVK